MKMWEYRDVTHYNEMHNCDAYVYGMLELKNVCERYN